VAFDLEIPGPDADVVAGTPGGQLSPAFPQRGDAGERAGEAGLRRDDTSRLDHAPQVRDHDGVMYSARHRIVSPCAWRPSVDAFPSGTTATVERVGGLMS
jgi:hypothetical protein